MKPVLHAASLRHLLRHPAQLLLALLGLALGVGTIVAVDLATASSRRAFELSLAAVNGAATHQITGGSRGVDEQLYAQLRLHPVAAAAPVLGYAPVVEGYVTIGSRTLQLLGIDPIASAELQSAERPGGAGVLAGADGAQLRQLLTEPGAVLMSARTAAELGVLPGASIDVSIDGVTERARLIETITGESAGLDELVITDIAQAQEWLASPGRLSRIDVRIAATASQPQILAALRARLPPDLELVATRAAGRETFAMTDAFTTNLKAMSLLALLVGTLLIYGAVNFAVLQRRTILGVLRALGATRGEVLRVVLGEAAVLGLAGAIGGTLLGMLIGRSLVGLVSRTINDLYFAVAVREVSVSAATLGKALAAGLGTALVAALLPALDAAASRPQLTLARSLLEQRSARWAARLALAGAIMCAVAGIAVSSSGRSLPAGFVALFLLLLGVAALAPMALRALAVSGARLARGHAALRLACADIAASLSRTGVAIGALAMALTAMIGVAIMVQSFRESLREWLTQTMRADVYVSAPGGADAAERRLEPQVTRALLAVPGVRDHSEARRAEVQSEHGALELNALRPAAGSYAGFHFTAGEPRHAWQQFRQGAVLVSEPLAWRLRLSPGATLTLRTPAGARAFPVAAVYREYGNERGEVLMDLGEYRRLWGDDGISAIGVYLAPGVTARQAVAGMRAAAQGRQALLIRSNADIRDLSMGIFERTFVITRVLYWLAAGVAAVGLVSALLAWELERARQLALLRTLGLTPRAAAGLVTAQTLFMASAAFLAAIPAGLLTALVLTEVINRRAFGWQIDLHLSLAQFANALLLALVAALAAAIYPAWRAARTPLAQGLREE
jgi:putative ABC transport system permease protein